jgi:hypothetical protein
MESYLSTIRKPVKRMGAENYLFITLISFAGTVSLVQLFLNLTGYPQLGGGTLHIAHLLWGGLALFFAAILPLIYANRWVYTIGAILSGIGGGLFIDEVGKFITLNNNYFYPPAAPIIYAFFLLTVLIYLRIRKPERQDARTELYEALDALEEVLDRDLDPREKRQLEERLRFVSEQQEIPDLALFAKNLLDFIQREGLYLAPEPPRLIGKIEESINQLEIRMVTRIRFRAFLAGALGALGVFELISLIQVLIANFVPGPLLDTLAELARSGIITSSASMNFFYIRVILEGAAGVILFVSAVFLLSGKERQGTNYSYLALLISLTTVDLLIFYFNQFSTIFIALMQFTLLLGVIHYRRRYLHQNGR